MPAVPEPLVLDDPDDVDWGRVCGCPPPLAARTPLWFALVGGAALVAVVLLLIRLPGPLDERTLADQRNGLIASGPEVGPEVAGVEFGGKPVVLLFQRTLPEVIGSRSRGVSLSCSLGSRASITSVAGTRPFSSTSVRRIGSS